MNKQNICFRFLAISTIVGITAFSCQNVKAQSNSENGEQKGSAMELMGIREKTRSAHSWGIGEGSQQKQERYQIRKINSFFDLSGNSVRSQDLLNLNNNVGDKIPRSGQVDAIKF